MAAGFDESRVAFGGVFIRRDGRTRTVLPGSVLFSDEGRTAPDVYRSGTRVTCSPEACSTSRTRGASFLGLTYQDSGASAPDAANVIILAGWGRDVQIDAAEKGWVLRELRANVAAVWAMDQAEATGVQSRFGGAEVFTSATAPGGPRGSIAVAQPPCARQSGVVTAGVGSATLSGGPKPVTVQCPADTSGIGSSTDKATRWTFGGTVAGASGLGTSNPGPLRLFVLNC